MGGGANLFPESSDEEEVEVEKGSGGARGGGRGLSISINKNYAERYDRWRNKEEQMKVKARIENMDSEEDESSSSEEEEPDWSGDKEKQFLKTLALLKKKDPKIYDPKIKFFEEKEEQNKTEKNLKKKEEKPYLLKDHERTMILEKGGLLSSDEEEEEDEERKYKKKQKVEGLGYYQQLDEIKKGFNEAVKGIESDEDEGEDLLMKSKPKTKEEEQKDEEDYRLWLKGERERLESGKLSKDEVKELSFLRGYWNDEKLDEGEKFLRDYILNKKYIDPEEENQKRIPSYHEIIHDSDEEGLSNDEKFEDEREEFEHKYNFRFEEPDPEFIKRYPRTIEDSLRRGDESRKKQRDSAKERKKEAKDRKYEEVQRLKALKRKEIMDKLKQVQEITGEQEIPVEALDLEGDFDPEEYDRKMQKLFGDQYQEVEEYEKPEFPYDPMIDDDEENWADWVADGDEDTVEFGDEEEDEADVDQESSGKSTKSKIRVSNEESEDEDETDILVRQKKRNEDEAGPSTSFSRMRDDLIEMSKGRKAKLKKSKFAEAIHKKKPKFDPSVHKSFSEYFNEYYSLDFEDLVGDLPCRFKYRKVAPNDFGLTTSEILKAPDRELNQWASLKKTYQYRPEEEEKYEIQAYKKKSENERLKKRTLLSVYQPGSNEENGEDKEEEIEEEEENTHDTSAKKKKKNKKKGKTSGSSDGQSGESSEHQETEMLNDTSTTPVSPSKSRKDKIVPPSQPSLSEKLHSPDVCKSKGEKPHENEMGATPESTEPKLSKRQRKNRRRHQKTEEGVTNKNEDMKINGVSPSQQKAKPQQQNGSSNNSAKQFKGKRNNNNNNKRPPETSIDDERLKAYGMNPKKYKKWVKYGESSSQHQMK